MFKGNRFLFFKDLSSLLVILKEGRLVFVLFVRFSYSFNFPFVSVGESYIKESLILFELCCVRYRLRFTETDNNDCVDFPIEISFS